MMSDKKRSSNLMSMEKIMDRSLKGGFLHFISNRARLTEIWQNVVGEEIAAKTNILAFEVGRLEIGVKGPAYLERYQYYKKDWIKRLNIEYGDEVVTEIVLTVAQK
jgi:hypothetical protein